MKIEIEQLWTPFFAHLLLSDITPVRSSATARYAGTSNICLLALAPSGLSGIHLNLFARVEAHDCGVYSNTRSIAGIRLDVKARLSSSLNCSAGGVLGLLSNMTPAPITDCPDVKDPLAGRAVPENRLLRSFRHRHSHRQRDAEPRRLLRRHRDRRGCESAFFPRAICREGRPPADSRRCRGRGPEYRLLSHRAQRDDRLPRPSACAVLGRGRGIMAGLLLFEDRAAPLGRVHIIRNTRAEELTGTIYLSRARCSSILTQRSPRNRPIRRLSQTASA